MPVSIPADERSAGPASVAVIVVPCFNEEERWNLGYWSEMVTIPNTRWLFIDDGSSDGTGAMLQEFCGGRESCQFLQLPANQGKAEAVRQGLVAALRTTDLDLGPVGFIDADGAFVKPDVVALLRLWGTFNDQVPLDALWSSRVLLKGRSIDRRPMRHYVARSVSTLLEIAYPGLPYDTQSGFKLFRASPELEACLHDPFRTRWLFEIELLIRWQALTGRAMGIWEEPVTTWRDVAGSKVAGRELLRIGKELIAVTRLSRRMPRATSGSSRPDQGCDRPEQ